MLQFCTLPESAGFRPRSAVPAAQIRSSEGRDCARLEVRTLPCCSIILYKIWVFRRSQRHSVNFLDVFRRSNKFSEVQAVCRSLGDSPLVGLFQAGYAELTAQLRLASPVDAAETQALNPKAAAN